MEWFEVARMHYNNGTLLQATGTAIAGMGVDVIKMGAVAIASSLISIGIMQEKVQNNKDSIQDLRQQLRKAELVIADNKDKNTQQEGEFHLILQRLDEISHHMSTIDEQHRDWVQQGYPPRKRGRPVPY